MPVMPEQQEPVAVTGRNDEILTLKAGVVPDLYGVVFNGPDSPETQLVALGGKRRVRLGALGESTEQSSGAERIAAFSLFCWRI